MSNGNWDMTLIGTAFILGLEGIKGFHPSTSDSLRWVSWITNFGRYTCLYCAEQNGKIYEKDNPPDPEPEVHPNCHCILDTMLSIIAGTATIEGTSGADYYCKYYNTLPDNYVSKKYAISREWRAIKGNLRKVLPNAIIGGDIYKNFDGRLPQARGRIWYEADINYTGGYRNTHRVVYSNDGLVFVTYDHYLHFYPIE